MGNIGEKDQCENEEVAREERPGSTTGVERLDKMLADLNLEALAALAALAELIARRPTLGFRIAAFCRAEIAGRCPPGDVDLNAERAIKPWEGLAAGLAVAGADRIGGSPND